MGELPPPDVTENDGNFVYMNGERWPVDPPPPVPDDPNCPTISAADMGKGRPRAAAPTPVPPVKPVTQGRTLPPAK